MADHIRVISKVEGFRRCGIAHSEEPRFHPIKSFTREQLLALKGERMLVVDEMDPPAEAEGTDPKKKGPAKPPPPAS